MSNKSNGDIATQTDGIEHTLESLDQGNTTSYELYFDRETGELRAGGQDDEDRLPATQMAREGFFLGDAEEPDAATASTAPAGDVFNRNAPVLETDALADRTVLVVGLGSGGSTVVDLLARSGVGHVVLWDNDCLDVHNVARHICTQRDVGRRKVDAMRDHVLSINPGAQVESIHEDVIQAGDDLDAAVERVDCVVAGTDNNASRFAINEAAIRASKPAYFGRAFTRACGGDVIQVLPNRDALLRLPCGSADSGRGGLLSSGRGAPGVCG